MATRQKSAEVKVGVSSCLLGQEVRFDGGHKRNAFVAKRLANYFEFVHFCPEAAAGLGIPRPTIHLKHMGGTVRLVQVKNNDIDVTDQITEISRRAAGGMAELSGYILKKDSPSCGMERVRIYKDYGLPPDRNGRGLFAQALLEAHPNLPVEEEGRLSDAALRENFIQRVYAYHRWQQLEKEGLTVHGLMDFHSRHKLILLAHDENIYRKLGPLVASLSRESLPEKANQYIRLVMQALKKQATRKRHTNVMQHMMGYLKKDLSSEDKQEFNELLTTYRKGQVPLIVPLTLLRHHLRRSPQPYIAQQHYLEPYPEELMLRNNV